ncbi:hypothetical protein IL306_007868 [Fusarium sp. DS 682]|nr:hypothetical protein IL306_007868 [Fusarium sp. DS 682]
MELSWLQSLNLLLAQVGSCCRNTSMWRKDINLELKFTLLSLADRRKASGGLRVVTNEHLIKAMHYFDVRSLVYELDYDYAEERNVVRQGYFTILEKSLRNLSGTDTSDSASEDQSDSSSSASTRRQLEDQNPASSAKTSALAKRKAPDDMSSQTPNPKRR